jgi:ribosomal-protein-alanine N-acetyltransferase
VVWEYARRALELQRLRSDHAAAVLAFEVANRTYFAASITGLRTLKAENSNDNVASQRVLAKAGGCVRPTG